MKQRQLNLIRALVMSWLEQAPSGEDNNDIIEALRALERLHERQH